MRAEPVDSSDHAVSRRIVVDGPVGELFAMVADPHRHHEIDGSGTVRSWVRGPHRLTEGAHFTVLMRMFGLPYVIRSRVTAFADGRIVEWQHPLRHRWRWEFRSLGPESTEITETFDYSRVLSPATYERIGIPTNNAAGIGSTLSALADRYA